MTRKQLHALIAGMVCAERVDVRGPFSGARYALEILEAAEEVYAKSAVTDTEVICD